MRRFQRWNLMKDIKHFLEQSISKIVSVMNNINGHPADSSLNGNTRLCYYRNRDSKLQQIVINGALKKEKIVFPGEQLLFWAHPKDQLTIKILKSENIIVNSIICEHLLVH